MSSHPRGDVIAHTRADAGHVFNYPGWLKDRLESFQDLKFGLMLHWGPYCQWNCIESWPLVEADIWARPDDLKAWNDCGRDLELFRQRYWELNRTFNPEQFDPTVWAAAARRAGMTYVNFTTKHHDGFCMFDTRTTDYKVTAPDCPFHRDPRANVTARVFEAFRNENFAVSCYFSKSDWHSPHYWNPEWPAPDRNPNYDTGAHPERWERFVRFVHEQVRELMCDYGPIDILWLDGGQVRPPHQDIRMAEIAAMARSYQPGLIVADRTVGGAYENVITPEQEIPDAPLAQPWESCLTMGHGWSYRADDHYKPARQLIHMLVDIVSKGGNFLLNAGPGPDGRLADAVLDRLREIGEWMDVNGEAIHGTRIVYPYRVDNLGFTRRGDSVYCIVFPETGTDHPDATVRIPWFTPRPGRSVSILGCTDAPSWSPAADGGISVSMPLDRLPCEHAWVIRMVCDAAG